MSAAQPSPPTTTTTPPAADSKGAASTSTGSNQPKPPPRAVPPYLRPLQYVGIPKSVLSWQPRLPSRNWSIFIVTVGTLSYLYYDDRKQCRLIKEDYIDKVRHLSEVPMKTAEWPRKLRIYGTQSPGDDDEDKALRYFRKYVKPFIVAAGIDWESLNGNRHGGLARGLQSQIQERRRKLLGLEPWVDEETAMLQNSFSLTPQQELQREIDGGIVIVGRPAYKEWAWALRNGWCSPLEAMRVERDDELAQELAEDNAFDEVVDPQTEQLDAKEKALATLEGESDGAGAPLPSRFGASSPYSLGPGPNAFSGVRGLSPAENAKKEWEQLKQDAKKAVSKLDPRLLEPPAQIPAQPPICFVDFTNLVGWRNIPLRMYQFFRQRDKVRHGAEVALTIVYGTKETARDFQPARPGTLPGQVPDLPPQGGDLDWGIESEEKYPPYFLKSEKNLEKAREQYYKELPKHLKDARDLARGLREPSKIEKNSPSKTEPELREERFNKEKKWRDADQGYQIIRPEAGVTWDEKFRGSLRVFELPSHVRQQIDEEQKVRARARKSAEAEQAQQDKLQKERQAQQLRELEAQPLED